MDLPVFGVFYTDGGCYAAQKLGGWGIHAYLYNGEVAPTGTGLKDWFITPRGYLAKKDPLSPENRSRVWSLLPELAKNPQVTDVNVLCYLELTGVLLEKATNNLAELIAVIKAIELGISRELQHIQIYTDSQYVQVGYTDMLDRWSANGWKNSNGERLANIPEWEHIKELKALQLGAGHTLTLSWVRGHNGNLGNERADYLATRGLILADKGISEEIIEEHVPTKYWKANVEINRLFTHNRWYFNTCVSATTQDDAGRYVYHVGNHGKDDDFLGKQMANASFAVLKLEQPEPVLETLRTLQRELDVERLNSIMIGRLDFIFKPKVYTDLLANGGNFIQKRKARLDLYTADDLQLTKELRPPRLAFNLIDIMGSLEFRLDEVITGTLGTTVTTTDITGEFFIIEVKGKKSLTKLKPEWNSTVKSLSVMVKHPLEKAPNPHPITLTFGMDLPHRNALAALAPLNPHLEVICWMESSQAFRYATVIRCGKDYGIFAGYYSNIQLVFN